jgi:hypothetical protein
VSKITNQPVAPGDVFLDDDRTSRSRADGSVTFPSREVIWDVGIADPTAPSHFNHSHSSATFPFAAAKHYQYTKQVRYQRVAPDPTKSLVYFILENTGALGPDATKFRNMILSNKRPSLSDQDAKSTWQYFKRIVTSLCVKAKYSAYASTAQSLIAFDSIIVRSQLSLPPTPHLSAVIQSQNTFPLSVSSSYNFSPTNPSQFSMPSTPIIPVFTSSQNNFPLSMSSSYGFSPFVESQQDASAFHEDIQFPPTTPDNSSFFLIPSESSNAPFSFSPSISSLLAFSVP